MRLASTACALALLYAGAAQATSITPLVERGVTFTDRKAAMVTVANAYSATQTIRIEAFEPDLATPAPGVRLAMDRITLASNERRRIRVIFDVPNKEREIAICVSSEQPTDGMVVPRVCGRFYARRADIAPR